MKDIETIIQAQQATCDELLQAYDDLDGVSLDFMIGRWRGLEIHSGHRLDGLLEQAGWYGKVFLNQDAVHPLIFFKDKRTKLYAVNPQLIPLQLTAGLYKVITPLSVLVMPLLKTKLPAARLQMYEFRGKTTATMVYRTKPIQDSFRKIDDNRVLGVMDLKGDPHPFFFVLIRDEENPMSIDLK